MNVPSVTAITVAAPMSSRVAGTWRAMMVTTELLSRNEVPQSPCAHVSDLDRNWVSRLSPIARALLNARLGQRVRFNLPSGETELEVVGIAFA